MLPAKEPRVRVYLPQAFFGGQRTRTAVHEAGHAVLAWEARCVMDVTSAQIVADDDERSAGLVKYRSRLPVIARDNWEQVSICLAGLAAEVTMYGSCQKGGAEDDIRSARELVDEIYQGERGYFGSSACPWNEEADKAPSIAGTVYGDDERSRKNEIIDSCYRHALAKIREHRHLFDAVAAALDQKGRLDQDELATLLGERQWYLFR